MGSPNEPDLVPPENQPGHHPPEEQDKPDLDAFAAKLGTDPKAPTATGARKAAPAKSTPAKSTPAKSSSRPAATNPKKSPAPPPTRGSGGAPQKNSEVTPAKRPAAVLAPTHEEAAHFSAPQPEPEGQEEPRLVGLVLLPLRQTIKRLEQLERKLTDRLATGGRGSRGR